MKTRSAASSCLLSAASLLACLLSMIVPVFAGTGNPIVIHPDKVGVSQTVREIAKTVGPPVFHGWIIRKEHETPSVMTRIYDIPDPVIQDNSTEPELSVNLGFNFDGMNGVQAGGVIPPDTNGAVGDNQFFLITNLIII